MNIIFSDVDGTFQDLGATIPDINLKAVEALQQQGDRFVFVSGRNYEQIKQVIEDSGLDCDIIFSNGAGYRLKGEEPNYSHTLSLKQLEYILKVLDEKNCFYHIHTSEKVYMKPMHNFVKHMQDLREALVYMGDQGKRMMDFKEDYFTNKCEHVEDLISYFKEHPEIKPLKVELMDPSDDFRANLKQLFENEGFSAFSSVVTGLEIIDPESNKIGRAHV